MVTGVSSGPVSIGNHNNNSSNGIGVFGSPPMSRRETAPVPIKRTVSWSQYMSPRDQSTSPVDHSDFFSRSPPVPGISILIFQENSFNQ